LKFLEALGAVILRAFTEMGRFVLLFVRTVTWAVRPPYDVPELFKQMVRVGVDSIPVVFLTGLFTGGVIALETYSGFQRFHAESFVGSVVALSVTRELAPVLAALMVTGRVGSAMAAELGTMRVTEQIDALVALATEPIQYLIVPRVAAATVMLPLLVVMADAVGIAGGYFVAVDLLGANSVSYVHNTFQFLERNDFTAGLIKAAVFGLLFSMIGCQKGYYTEGGAEGVGIATTRAVVAGSLAILVADFFLAKVLF
jgi:phospholipid/cholesterol/gamma-HCH transport system permease protein